MIDLSAQRAGLAGDVQTQDVLTGTEGADTLFGSEGDDTISGLGGNDSIRGYGGSDSIDGGDGDDSIWLYAGGDTVHGGPGADYVIIDVMTPGAAAGGAYYGEDGLDVFFLRGRDAKGVDGVTIDAGTGNDFVQEWSAGDDHFDGGDGVDYLVCNRRPHSITLDLVAGTCIGKDVGTDVISGFEGFTGGRADDLIKGDDGFNSLGGKNGADVILGAGGGDSLFGGGAFDTLTGGAGSDTMTGGGGRDTFVFLDVGDSANDHPDLITVLKKHDVIDLSAIDADVDTAGDQAFVKVKAFDGHAGQLTMSFASGQTLLQVDVDGDAAADMTIAINGYHLPYDAFML